MSWNQAYAATIGLSNGGKLACVQDAVENDFILNLPLIGVGAFLGGYNIWSATNGQWVSGEPWQYTHWNDGEPNYTNNDHVLEMYTHNSSSPRLPGYWNNIYVDHVSVEFGCYVVEYDSDPTIPHISLDSSSLSFAAYQNCELPSSKSFTITNTGGDTLEWAVTHNSTWLDVEPTSDASNSQVVTVSVNTTNRTPGTYKDTILVTSTNADNDSQKVVVTYVVNPGPHLVAAPTTLNFSAAQHCALPASQSFTITNSGNCTLDWTASCIAPWLNLEPTSGPSNNQTITVSVNTTELPLGLHCDTLCITSTNADNSPQQVIVCHTINPGPHMSVNPTTLNFSATENGPLPPSQGFTLSNSTGCALNWEVAVSLSDTSWLMVQEPDSGSSNNETIEVEVRSTHLPAATYTGTITVIGYNADNSPIPVTVHYTLAAVRDTLVIGQPNCLVAYDHNHTWIPIYLHNQDTLKAGDIPLLVDTSEFKPDSVSFIGTRLTEGPTIPDAYGIVSASGDTVRVGFSGMGSKVLLPATDATRDTPIAKICFGRPYACASEMISPPDTCRVYLPGGNVQYFVVVKPDGTEIVPALVRDSTKVLDYKPGDCNGDDNVNISDAVCIIAYIFSGGTPTCYAASDANGDGTVNISDAVYLIAYIFSGGTIPGATLMCDYGGGWIGIPPFPKLSYGSAELVASPPATVGSGMLSLTGTNTQPIAGLQLEFAVPENVEITGVTSNIAGMDVFSGMVDGLFKVGLIDMNGQTTIPAGKRELVTITYASTSSGPTADGGIELRDAIVVGEDASEMNVTITNKGTDATASRLPRAFSLLQNIPNPFNPTTEIGYSIPKTTQVRIEVLNVLGQSVRTLVDEYKAAGDYSVLWDGRDNSQQSVASGIYLYRISAGEFTETRKMVLMK